MLRLDPRFPLIWRTPTSLQLGSVHPVVTLDSTTPNVERAIAVLREGAPPATLRAMGRQWHLADDELDALLTRLEPALELASDPSTRPRVVVEGSIAGSDEIRRALGDAWDVDEANGAHPNLVVIVANFVTPLAVAGHWLRRDVPHLCVTLDESGADVGPLVVPGMTPCLHCLDEQRRRDDDCWTAIATQLLFAAPPHASSELRFRVASEVARVAREWHDHSVTPRARIRVALSDDRARPDGDGVVHRPQRTSDFRFSDECQCRALRENVSEFAIHRETRTMLPTTS